MISESQISGIINDTRLIGTIGFIRFIKHVAGRGSVEMLGKVYKKDIVVVFDSGKTGFPITNVTAKRFDNIGEAVSWYNQCLGTLNQKGNHAVHNTRTCQT